MTASIQALLSLVTPLTLPATPSKASTPQPTSPSTVSKNVTANDENSLSHETGGWSMRWRTSVISSFMSLRTATKTEDSPSVGLPTGNLSLFLATAQFLSNQRWGRRLFRHTRRRKSPPQLNPSSQISPPVRSPLDLVQI